MRSVGEFEQPAIRCQRFGIEAFDLGGDARRKSLRIEKGDRRDAAPAHEGRLPTGVDIVADGRDKSKSGDCDATPCAAHVSDSIAAMSTRALATTLPSTRAP